MNIGHKTTQGYDLTQDGILKVLRYHGVDVDLRTVRVTVGEYDGEPETTTTLHAVADGYGLTQFDDISNTLAQECIAVVHLPDVGGAAVAVGKLYGANPKGYAFDWAQFRI